MARVQVLREASSALPRIDVAKGAANARGRLLGGRRSEQRHGLRVASGARPGRGRGRHIRGDRRLGGPQRCWRRATRSILVALGALAPLGKALGGS